MFSWRMLSNPQEDLLTQKTGIPRAMLTWKAPILRKMLTWKSLMPGRMPTWEGANCQRNAGDANLEVYHCPGRC